MLHNQCRNQIDGVLVKNLHFADYVDLLIEDELGLQSLMSRVRWSQHGIQIEDKRQQSESIGVRKVFNQQPGHQNRD